MSLVSHLLATPPRGPGIARVIVRGAGPSCGPHSCGIPAVRIWLSAPIWAHVVRLSAGGLM